jgi:hypothetical protein
MASSSSVAPGVVTLADALYSDGHEEVAAHDAVALPFVDQPPGPGEPAAAPRRLAIHQQREAHPECGKGGALHVPPVQELLMGAGEVLGALVVPADEVRGRREPVEVVGAERRLTISG